MLVLVGHVPSSDDNLDSSEDNMVVALSLDR